MASRFPINDLFSVTITVSREGVNSRALCPSIPGFNLVGPDGAVRADIGPVLTAMVSKSMLRHVVASLTHEFAGDGPGHQLLTYDIQVAKDPAAAIEPLGRPGHRGN